MSSLSGSMICATSARERVFKLVSSVWVWGIRVMSGR